MIIFRNLFLVVFFVFILSGCSTFLRPAEADIFLEKNNRFVFPPPDSLGYKVSATQLFHGQYGRHQFDIQVVVEADNNELRMVGLAPWGGQLYSIKLSKGKIEYKELDNSRMRINPEYTVTDFILTYWPISVLNNWISKKGLRVTETGSNPVTRTILDEDRPVITINYKNKDKWKGKISFKNIKQDYSFQIETVRVDIQ